MLILQAGRDFTKPYRSNITPLPPLPQFSLRRPMHKLKNIKIASNNYHFSLTLGFFTFFILQVSFDKSYVSNLAFFYFLLKTDSHQYSCFCT